MTMVDPIKIIHVAHSDGLNLSLSDTGFLEYEGPEHAVEKWIDTIRACKAEICTTLAEKKHDTPAMQLGVDSLLGWNGGPVYTHGAYTAWLDQVGRLRSRGVRADDSGCTLIEILAFLGASK